MKIVDYTKSKKKFIIRDKDGHILARIGEPMLLLEGSAYCKHCKKVIDFKDCEIIIKLKH